MNTQQATILQQLLDKIEKRASIPNSSKLAIKFYSAKSVLNPAPVTVGSGKGKEGKASISDQKTRVNFEAVENLFLDQLEKEPQLRSFLKRVVTGSVFPSGKETLPIDFDGESTSSSILANASLCFDLVKSFVPEVRKDVAAQFWLHTIKRGFAARSIARRIAEVDPGIVFFTSLFFGMGRVAFLAQLKESYVGFLENSRKQGVSVLSMEMASLGFDHRIIGAKLLQRWEGPPSVVDAILAANHDSTNSDSAVSQQPKLTKVILAAELVARSLAPAGSYASTEDAVDPDVLVQRFEKDFDFSASVLDAIIKSVDRPARELSAALQLNLGEDAFPAAPVIKVSGPGSKKSDKASKSSKQASATTKKPDASAGPQEVKDKNLKKPQPPKPEPVNKKGEKPPAIEKVVDKKLSDLDQQFKKWQDEEEGRKEEARKEETDPNVYETQKWTGDRQFTGNVAAALRVCREARKELGLVLLEIDRFEDLLFAESIDDIYQIQKKVRAALETLAEKEGGTVAEVSDERFAVILPQKDLTQTARFGKTVLQLLRSWSAMRMKAGHSQVTFSIGSVAAAYLNDRVKPLHLIQGAQRCLGAVKLQSGNGHKSISLLC